MFRLATTTIRPLRPSLVRFASTEPPVMQAVRESLKAAMRSGDNSRKTVIRAVMSQIKNANLESSGAVATDIQFYDTVKSMAKKRTKSAEEFAEAGRQDLADKELEEIKILEELASQVDMATEEEVKAHIQRIAAEKGLESLSGIQPGKVMKLVPWGSIESEWKTSRATVVDLVKKLTQATPGSKRQFSTSRSIGHENPLGLPRRGGGAGAPRMRPGQKTVSKAPIPKVKKVVVVSSAKGGVGKSTVAANLALGLYEKGLSVGLLDVDVFGPSVPKLLNLSGEPRMNDEGKLIPMQNYGIKAMSMGFLVDPNKAVAWRGLLVQKALQQLLFEVDWGHLDVLVLDMPPGTGDIQLTLAQQVQIDGAVIVSTPQDIALIDAVRGIQMFGMVKIPVLGLVQNMSVYVCPNCNHQSHIFGTDGALKLAREQGIDILSEIPLSADICTSSDQGKPIVLSEGPVAESYQTLSQNVLDKLDLKGQ